MLKRWRTPTAKPGELKASYGRTSAMGLDIYYTNEPPAGRPDARVLAYAFEDTDVFDGRSLRQVLIDRGYDITTLRFSIQKATTSNQDKGTVDG